MSSSLRSWECAFPGCGKRFTRKEHLNRHTLIHQPEHQYKCQICGRRYARSDVYKRHVKQHNPEVSEPQPSDTRSVRICLPCGQRNAQCDGNSPCGACVSTWTECRWIGSDNNNQEAITEQANVLLSTNAGQASWIPPTVDTWNSRQFSVNPLFSTMSSDMGGDQQMQGVMESASFATPVPNIGTHIVEPITYDASNAPQISPQSTPTSQMQQQANSGSPVPMPAGLVELEASLDRDSLTTKKLFQVFLRVIHPYWPILHEPTFKQDKCPTMLSASIIMLASWLENGPEHKKLAPLVFDEVNRIQMDLHPPLYFLQSVLLYVVYATCNLTSEGMVAKALNLTGLLISTCRYLGVFNGQYNCHEQLDKDCKCPFVGWRVQEQLNRLAFSVLRVDAYLSVLLDHPPSLRYQELCIPLPKSEQLWAATNDEDRRRLQWNEPAGREKALFSFFMRDSLDPTRIGNLPYFLTDIDHHLNACATQTHIWEAARESHSSMSDELVQDIDPLMFLKFAHPHLAHWDKRKQECDARERYFDEGSMSDGKHILAPLTLTLMYVSTLKLNAPLNVLRARGHYYKSRPGVAIPTRKPQAHLRSWITSGIPRTALWNAAKIYRIFAIESGRPNTGFDSRDIPTSRARLRLNPLLIPGVLMSAIVVCSYARYTRSCTSCRRAAEAEKAANATPCCPQMAACKKSRANTNNAVVAAEGATTSEEHRQKEKEKEDEPIELFELCDNNSALERWKQRGVGIPYWGRGEQRIPVCMCRLSDLAASFRDAFVEDEGAEMEFVIFLAELSREGQ